MHTRNQEIEYEHLTSDMWSKNITYEESALPFLRRCVVNVELAPLHADKLLLGLGEEHDHPSQEAGHWQGVGDGQPHQSWVHRQQNQIMWLLYVCYIMSLLYVIYIMYLLYLSYIMQLLYVSYIMSFFYVIYIMSLLYVHYIISLL